MPPISPRLADPDPQKRKNPALGRVSNGAFDSCRIRAFACATCQAAELAQLNRAVEQQMPNGIKLSDGRTINAEYIVLVSSLDQTPEHADFNIEFSNSSKIRISGKAAAVVMDYENVCRAIGIPEKNISS
ncbi:hypothetical protein [Xanthomonas citri]|uniref:hypothetical protein n=1 Tax=Xanthomonas citri TaxID=346 RepID=UPI00131B09E7|nr:hypothetical protein [Xanthomonas citri]